MKAKVNKDSCIGCGACQAIAPNVFEIGDDGLSKTIVSEVPEADEEYCKDAIESCPTGAIVEE